MGYSLGWSPFFIWTDKLRANRNKSIPTCNGNTNLKNGTTYREGNLKTTVKTKKSGRCHSFVITSIN